jgi:hypothetical protein
VHGQQKWPILRIPCARNLTWPGSTGQIGFPNNPPQDRFETKAIGERNDGPISSYHISPDLVVARPLFNSEREIRISDKHDRRGVPLKFAVTRLAGNEMHLLRLDPSVERRVKEAVRRGQHLTRPNQCAGAISREAYEKRVLAHPETKQALLEILAFRLRQADEELAAATFLSVKARVARALLELAEFVGKPSGPQCIVLDEKISHADLARWPAWRGKTPAACWANGVGAISYSPASRPVTFSTT